MKFDVSILLLVLLILGKDFSVCADTRQQLDSLLYVIKEEKDQEKLVDNYNIIAEIYGFTHIDSAVRYINKALKLSESIKYKWGEAESYFLLGYYNNRHAEPGEAIKNFKKASELFAEAGDSSYLVGCYNNLGVMYSYGSDQVKSLKYFIQALHLAEQLNESYALSEAYTNVGYYYEYLKEYGSALKCYKKSLDIDLERKDTENIAFSHIYVGNMYLKLLRYDDAYAHLKEAREIIPLIQEKYLEKELYLNIADYYVETKRLDSARAYIRQAEQMIDKKDEKQLYADLFFTKGAFELENKDHPKSIEHYKEALALYEELEVQDRLHELYTKLAAALSSLGRHNEAYNMLQEANKANESYKPHELAKLLGEFEREEAVKEERTRFLLQKALEDERREKELFRYRANSVIAIFSIVILLIVLGILLHSSSEKKKHHAELKRNLETIHKQKELLEENYRRLECDEKQLKKLNATKDKFFSIIAHDLKNPFNVLIGLSDLIRSDADLRESEEFDQVVEGMFQTASTGYSLLENLLEWSRTQTGNLGFEPEPLLLKNLFVVNSTLFQESAKAKDIVVNIPESDDKTAYADYNMMNFVIRNLLNNAIKFSYSESSIDVAVAQQNGLYIVDIKDKGVGMTPETQKKLFTIEHSVQREGTANEKGTGLGLILCKEFVEKNGGKIWVKSEKGIGSTFSFSVPVYKN